MILKKKKKKRVLVFNGYVSNSHLGEHCREEEEEREGRGGGESDGIMFFIQKFTFASEARFEKKKACLYSRRRAMHARGGAG